MRPDVVGPLDHGQPRLGPQDKLPGVVAQQVPAVAPVGGDDLDGPVEVLGEQPVGTNKVVLIVLLQDLGRRVSQAAKVHGRRVDLAGHVDESDHTAGIDVQRPHLAHDAVVAVVHRQRHPFDRLGGRGRRGQYSDREQYTPKISGVHGFLPCLKAGQRPGTCTCRRRRHR